jgi:hypothetical protein
MGTVSDDFNRANAGSLGANWTTGTDAGGYGISSNTAIGLTGGRNTVFWSANTFNATQSSKFAVITGNFNYGPAVRVADDDDDCYYVFYDNTNMAIWKMVNGGFTKLSADFACGSLTTGQTLELTVDGSDLAMLLDDVEVGTASDGDLAAGYAGILGNGTGALDNWSATGTVDVVVPLRMLLGAGG